MALDFSHIKHPLAKLIPVQEDDLDNRDNLLEPVWRDGKILRRTTFAEVRKLVHSQDAC